MADTLRLLATVSHHQAEAAGDDLEQIADQQEENLKKKQQIRDVQKLYDKITADDVVTFDELVTLHEMRDFIGSNNEAFWGSETVNEFEPHELGHNPWKYDKDKYSGEHGNNSHFYLKLNEEGANGAQVKEIFDNIEAEIDGKKDEVEDNQSDVQFQIQLGTSDLQNAENVRSQAEKRLEQQRKDLTRNWGG